MTTRAFGENGFRWFFGKVVEREKDPLKLGRLKVRVFGVHDDEGLIPDDKLPWATLLTPPYSAASNQVGITPLGAIIGSTVFGFFLDGNEGQLPVILGSLAGIPDNDESKHDLPKLARGTNDLQEIKDGSKVEGELVNEPGSPYGAKYPFNKVFRTETGHVIEIDDTSGQERIHVFHKSGTFVEINNEGTRVDKTIGDKYSVVLKNDNTLVDGDHFLEVKGKSVVLIKGTCSVHVEGDCSISAEGQLDISSDTKINMSAPEIHLNSEDSGSRKGFKNPNVSNSRYGG